MPAYRRVLVSHAQPEPAADPRRDQRVGERDGLVDGRDLVVAVGALGADREPDVELGARLDLDPAREGPPAHARR